MAYFAKEEPSQRRGKHMSTQSHHEEKPHGVRRIQECSQPTAEAGYMGKFTQSAENSADEMQRRHPEIKKQQESKVFHSLQEGPPIPPSKPRVRNVSTEALQYIQAPPDTRKDDAATKLESAPSMIDRMLGCNYPLPHPQHNEYQGRRNQPEYAKRRNESQIAVGGYHALPPDPFKPNEGARRTVQVDYSSYVSDRIQPKRFYAVDGRMVDGHQGAPLVKNFFSDEPLICSKWVAESGPQQSPRLGPAAVPEPPHRRAPFDHGHRSFM
jgi:hypothetical protein